MANYLIFDTYQKNKSFVKENSFDNTLFSGEKYNKSSFVEFGCNDDFEII